jgi:hypothetical protein
VVGSFPRPGSCTAAPGAGGLTLLPATPPPVAAVGGAEAATTPTGCATACTVGGGALALGTYGGAD